MTKKTAQSVIEKIKRERRHPRAAWCFWLKNTAIWAGVVIAVVAAGLLLASIAKEILDAQWEAAELFPGGRFEFIHETIPFVWLGVLVVLGVLAYVFFRQTKRGYRVGAASLAGVLVVAGVAFAVSFQPTPFPGKMRDFHKEHFGPPIEESEWNAPDEGRLFGSVISFSAEEIELKDVNGIVWKIKASDIHIPPFLEIEEGLKIRVIGKKIGRGDFVGKFVLPGDKGPPPKGEDIPPNPLFPVL